MFLLIKNLPKMPFGTSLEKKGEFWYKSGEQDSYDKGTSFMLDLAFEDGYLMELQNTEFEKPITIEDFVNLIQMCPSYSNKYYGPRNNVIERDNSGHFIARQDILKALLTYK